MKKLCMFALVLVLTLAVFAGCGCRRQEPAGNRPTDEMTAAPTTVPTTAVTEQATTPTQKPTDAMDATIVPDMTDGNSGILDGTDTMDGTNATDNTDSTAGTGKDTARARTIR